VALLNFTRRCSALPAVAAAAEPIDEAGDDARGRVFELAVVKEKVTVLSENSLVKG